MDMETYFDRLRILLDFYASPEREPDLAGAFVGNNVAEVKAILKHPAAGRHSDFVIWLHKMIKADVRQQAEEDEVKGETEAARARRLLREEFSGLTNINKFSIAYIEWLEEEMPDLTKL